MNKGSVARSFSRAVPTYDLWARAQKSVAERLVALLGREPGVRRVLDVGCGTGVLTRLLEARFSPERLSGIDLSPEMVGACRRRWPGHGFLAVDAEDFETSERYDLIASSCAFQWFQDKSRAAARYLALLAPGGLLALAAPVAGSFPELDQASRQAAGRGFSGLRLAEPQEYLAGCRAPGTEILCGRTESLRVDFPSVLDALRSFKGTGAVYQPEGQAPYTARQLGELRRRYESDNRNPDGTVPLTYRVLFLVARAPRA